MGFKKGHIVPPEWRQKVSFAMKRNPIRYWLGKKRPEITGGNSKVWKGNKAKYRALHMWVQKYKGKATYCQNSASHKAKRFHWSNKSGEYKRDLSDWIPLCPSCNKKDGIKIPERFYNRRRPFATL